MRGKERERDQRKERDQRERERERERERDLAEDQCMLLPCFQGAAFFGTLYQTHTQEPIMPISPLHV